MRKKTGGEETRRRLKDLRSQSIYDAEGAILEVTEQVCIAMDKQGISRTELAQRLGVTKAYVTQFLQGPNMTFQAAAKFAAAVGLHLKVTCEPATAATKRKRLASQRAA